MESRRIHILVAESSYIIRKGMLSVLLGIDSIGIDITDIEDTTGIKDFITQHKPDLAIINPLHLDTAQITLSSKSTTKFVALQSYILSSEQQKNYDAVISIFDSASQIEQTLINLINTNKPLKEVELSAREREIVAAIALGKSNKEIADELYISTHTVMTHRKNIASKLKIHNPAGLTIYAIVNKLIDIGDAK